MDIALKWLGQAIGFAAPYPYQNVYPTLTAARHIRSLSLFTSRDQETHTGTKPDQTLLLTIYPIKGIEIWLVELLVRYFVKFYLGNLLHTFLVACVITILLSPLRLFWIRSTTSNTTISIKHSIRSLRCVTSTEWVHFIGTLLACEMAEEVVQLSVNQAFGSFTPDPDAMGALEQAEAQRIGRKLIASIMVTSAVIRVMWVPKTVVTVAAALDPEEKRGTYEFYMYIKESVSAMPLSLWARFGIYHCIATMITFCLGLFGTVSIYLDFSGSQE
ncbi:hypothetical protein HG530_013852 [Fusarium avenaceum]|nr:hypothetical protein HG530_013852 [Fusarium avenaceum]